ncbi:MAG: EfeM/EfeO family lipoprotein [Chloroflexi bacterium]|nr:EfeM/EfeO family lipoprotein [Chloroflexota bacterium]
MKRFSLLGIVLVLLVALVAPAAPAAVAQNGPNLAGIKGYALDQASHMKTATEAFAAISQTYYDRIAELSEQYPDENPYEYFWNEHPDEVVATIDSLREQWFEASLRYELNEGIVAGVPSLSYYDLLLDAGPSKEEDSEEALEWTLVLPDGTELESPGNLFTHLSEPALYGTVDAYVALDTDLNGNGEIELSEVMPEANFLLGVALRLDEETANLLTAIEEWDPTLEDAFTALVIMLPTMNEYFEQWKLSSFVTGGGSEQISFVAVSRLFDVAGILHGLDVTYDQVGPLIEGIDPDLHAQIDSGFEDLVTYVTNLYEQEQAGVVFTPEEADALGTEAQDKGQTLAALVAQAAFKLGLELEL